MSEIAFRSCYMNVPREDRLEYEREQATLSGWNRSPGTYGQNRFEQWLMQPHVLKEWYERANRWRPEAKHPGSALMAALAPIRVVRDVESRLRWTPQVEFEHYKKCIVSATRYVDRTSQVPGRIRTIYTMYLYMDKASGRRVFEHENNYNWLPFNCDTDPIWSSVIDENTECYQWFSSHMYSGLRADLDRMGLSYANELPPGRMINKAPFYWKRVWALVRANALLDYWRAIIYVPGGSGAKRAEQSFESHITPASK